MKNKATYGLKVEDETLAWMSADRRSDDDWQLAGRGQVSIIVSVGPLERLDQEVLVVQLPLRRLVRSQRRPVEQ